MIFFAPFDSLFNKDYWEKKVFEFISYPFLDNPFSANLCLRVLKMPKFEQEFFFSPIILT
jgi:hypothetical protein